MEIGSRVGTQEKSNRPTHAETLRQKLIESARAADWEGAGGRGGGSKEGRAERFRRSVESMPRIANLLARGYQLVADVIAISRARCSYRLAAIR